MPDVCTNPGFETDTTGWNPTGAGESITRVTTEFRSGVASGRVITNASGIQEGAFFESTQTISSGDSLTSRMWVKGSGVVKVWVSTVAGTYKDIFKSAEVTLSGTWQQIQASGTATQSATEIRAECRTSDDQANQALTFYIDDIELIIPDPAGSFTLRIARSPLRW